MAPYTLDIIVTTLKNESLLTAATKFYDHTKASGIESVLDDRNESVGDAFKDAEAHWISVSGGIWSLMA